MPPPKVSSNHYQLWLNLVTNKLELHSASCTHGLVKQWRQYQQFGQPMLMTEQAHLDSVTERAVKLGTKFTPVPQNCAGQFYKGA